jgi:hypothetical protein
VPDKSFWHGRELMEKPRIVQAAPIRDYIRQAPPKPDYSDMYDFLIQHGLRVGIDAQFAEQFAKEFVSEKLKRRRRQRMQR